MPHEYAIADQGLSDASSHATVTATPGTEGGDATAGYRIDGTIAAGGFGTVYRAFDPRRGHAVALKVMHAELVSAPGAVTRFEREARVVARIRHPNVVEVYDVGRLPTGQPYFAMELLDGATVRQRLERSGRMSIEEATAVLASVCDALAAAHRLGVIHRDIKASNVVITRDGRVVLLDFGVAKLLDDTGPQLTTSRHVLGTPPCMAPEQILGEPVDERTDVYALGVLAFHMLTSVLPFRDRNAAVVQRMHLESDPPLLRPLAPVPAPIEALVHAAMAKEPDHRPADAPALFAAWQRALAAPIPRDRAGASIAVYLELAVDAWDALDDDSLDRIDDAVPLAVRELCALGLEPALVSGNSALVWGPLTGDAQRAAIDATCVELRELLTLTLAGAARVHLRARTGRADDLLHLDGWRCAEPALAAVA